VRGERRSLRLASRFNDVHAHDESILEAIVVANARVGDELARTRVADYLMDIDRNAAVGLLRESLGLNVARDGSELPAPVVADLRTADDPTALPGVGPIDLRVHQLDRGVNVASIEGAVGGSQGLLRV
jgi:hypothetical protein